MNIIGIPPLWAIMDHTGHECGSRYARVRGQLLIEPRSECGELG